MTIAIRILIVLTAVLTGLSDEAQARHRGMVEQMPSAPVVTQAPSPGLNTSGVNQPGVPNTSRPGTIGAGAIPSGLNGDSPTAPGFPGKVGRD